MKIVAHQVGKARAEQCRATVRPESFVEKLKKRAIGPVVDLTIDQLALLRRHRAEPRNGGDQIEHQARGAFRVGEVKIETVEVAADIGVG